MGGSYLKIQCRSGPNTLEGEKVEKKTRENLETAMMFLGVMLAIYFMGFCFWLYGRAELKHEAYAKTSEYGHLQQTKAKLKAVPQYTAFILKASGRVAVFYNIPGSQKESDVFSVNYYLDPGYMSNSEAESFAGRVYPKYYEPNKPGEEKQRAYLIERYIRGESVEKDWEKAVK